MNIREHVPLAPLTTLKVGGAARYFVDAYTTEDVVQALEYAHTQALPVFVLGGGSNIVVADEGFEGLTLRIRASSIVCDVRDGHALLSVDAGVIWDDLVAYVVERGFIGLECLSGIPGTVGGGVVVNLGAYGAECSDALVSIDVLARDGGTLVAQTLDAKECGFSYHDSMFGRARGKYIIMRATFSLPTSGAPRLSYQDNRFNLSALAKELGQEPTPADVRSAVLRMRGAKGTLVTSYQSAGSFFHMPFVSTEEYARVRERARALDDTKEERLRPWAWEQPDGSYKIAAGFLLEYTEFQKGYVRGPVGISPKHTLSIINKGGARASDIAVLARDMHDAVRDAFGISLEREVEYVGQVT